MEFFSRLKNINKELNRFHLVPCLLAIAAMSISTQSFADMSLESISNLEHLVEHKEAIDDADLSSIKGKGSAEVKLYENDRLAVILWDERGNDNHRTLNIDAGGRHNIQDVKLTIKQW